MQKQKVMTMEYKMFSSNVCCEIYASRYILIAIWKGFNPPVKYVKNI